MSAVRPLAELGAERLAEGARRGGVEGAHSFIRAIDADYDRELEVSRLSRAIDPADDLRTAAGDGSQERWVFAERLAWDSEFFGYGIARVDAVLSPAGPVGPRDDVTPAIAALEATLQRARAAEVEYVFATVAATDLPAIRAYQQAGFELIETRASYHMPLTGPPAERYATRLATEDDIPSLARAAREMVNPFDRFHADPAISAEDADRMMEEWVRASIAGGFADATVVPDEPAPEAFCTARYHREHWAGWGLRLGQPVLSAVSPRHRGWYVRIISELNEHLRSVGAEHSYLITQITNNAVIRSWEKLGYQFGKGEHVMRRLLR